jgi:TonB family protein
MKSCLLVSLFVVALFASANLFAEKGQDGTRAEKQDNTNKPTAQLKLIKSPSPPYPEEALKKNIEGRVVLSIVVDAQGRVSDARALSGPPELVQAAIESVRQWEFEPPDHPPVMTTAEISYGFPKECPGPISQSGQVQWRAGLENTKGTVLEMDDSTDRSTPMYLSEERKAGVAGKMVLSITVDAEGKVTKVRIIKSLSPRLDDATVATVRTWRFQLKAGNPGSLPDDFQLQFIFQPMCGLKP